MSAMRRGASSFRKSLKKGGVAPADVPEGQSSSASAQSLERWERLEEGRYVGKLQGRTVWLDVSLEVRNAQSTHGLGV